MHSEPSADNRSVLRQTFDSAADLYHRARPVYPERLFEDLIELTRLRTYNRILEIGCGTGKATIPLARRGYRIVALELGTRLAEQGAANLADFPDVTIVTASFDEWQPEAADFDLVVAATSWHWLNPDTRYARAAQALRHGGHLAFWSAAHVSPGEGDPFFRDIQSVYEEIGEGLPLDAPWPRPGELPDLADEIVSNGSIDDVHVRHYDWEMRYDAGSYIDLLNTFSGHLTMSEDKRNHLFNAIRSYLATRRIRPYAATGEPCFTSHSAGRTKSSPTRGRLSTTRPDHTPLLFEHARRPQSGSSTAGSAPAGSAPAAGRARAGRRAVTRSPSCPA